MSKIASMLHPNGSIEAPAAIKVPLIKSLLVILLISCSQLVNMIITGISHLSFAKYKSALLMLMITTPDMTEASNSNRKPPIDALAASRNEGRGLFHKTVSK